ncbi:hypothetical protein [Salibacterium halotolerans]|uniref:Uncharacterized protein n=1 Tax=Salibacterium halotolerans TaxID=1884432 RepID=A0A1I5R205_9BACI|nr:hypothetical protein [Salibacterium halotolerans]SFP52341.1 hypothetical protein SAMN05518683_106114 [Salibacterium halotolerans]
MDDRLNNETSNSVKVENMKMKITLLSLFTFGIHFILLYISGWHQPSSHSVMGSIFFSAFVTAVPYVIFVYIPARFIFTRQIRGWMKHALFLLISYGLFCLLSMMSEELGDLMGIDYIPFTLLLFSAFLLWDNISKALDEGG